MQSCARQLATIRARQRFLSPSLKTFETYREPLVLERGEGVYLWDVAGNRYTDMLGQNLCVSVGYNHPRIMNAARRQLQTLPHCTTVYYHEASARLAETLVSTLPPHPSGDDWVVHFVTSGSEAVDLAVQMARAYTGNHEMYALYKGYHGLQGCAAGLTAIGKASQKAYHSSYASIKHVPANAIDVLEHDLRFATCGQVAGILMEPLQGYGGIYPLDDGFMRDAYACVREAGGVAIADEVQTGFGRCGGTFWGFEQPNNRAVPDMVTMAKGMGNGVGLLGAVVSRRSIAEAFSDKVFFNTYGANPFSCAVGEAVVRVLREEGVLENCDTQGRFLRGELQRLCATYPSVFSDARGSGLFQGLEVRGTSADDAQERAREMHEALLGHGVIMGRGSAQGNLFRLQPPMSVSRTELEQVVAALECVASVTVTP